MKRTITFFISLAIFIGVLIYGDVKYITMGDDGFFLLLFIELISFFVCFFCVMMWIGEHDEVMRKEEHKKEYDKYISECYRNFNLDDAIKDIQPRILDNGKMRWDIKLKTYKLFEYDFIKTKTDIRDNFENVKKAPSYYGDRCYYADDVLADNKYARVIIDLEDQKITYSYIEEINATKQVYEQGSSVYLMFNPLNKTYKIGKANDVDKRLKALQTGNPDIQLVTYKTYASEKDAFRMENMLHRQYEDSNYKKEWFNLNEEDVEFIKQTLS